MHKLHVIVAANSLFTMLKRIYEVNPEREAPMKYRPNLQDCTNQLGERWQLQTQGKLQKALFDREVFDFELGSSSEEDEIILREIGVMHDFTQSSASGGLKVDNRGLFKSAPARPD